MPGHAELLSGSEPSRMPLLPLALAVFGVLGWIAGAAKWWVQFGAAYGIAWLIGLPALALLPALRQALRRRRDERPPRDR
jgi:hypothetical protein